LVGCPGAPKCSFDRFDERTAESCDVASARGGPRGADAELDESGRVRCAVDKPPLDLRGNLRREIERCKLELLRGTRLSDEVGSQADDVQRVALALCCAGVAAIGERVELACDEP
jgi:hypothetical protein